MTTELLERAKEKTIELAIQEAGKIPFAANNLDKIREHAGKLNGYLKEVEDIDRKIEQEDRDQLPFRFGGKAPNGY